MTATQPEYQREAVAVSETELEACQLPNGEWVIANRSEPLTEEEAAAVVEFLAALGSEWPDLLKDCGLSWLAQ